MNIFYVQFSISVKFGCLQRSRGIANPGIGGRFSAKKEEATGCAETDSSWITVDACLRLDNAPIELQFSCRFADKLKLHDVLHYG